MRFRVLATLSIIPVLVAACGGGERLSVEEYARFCAGGIASAAELIEPDNVTWGDIVEIGTPSIERLRSVEAPDELATFHRVSLKTLEFVVGEARDHPPEELANPLALGLSAVRIATQLRRAIEDLPDDLRRTLSEAGCL